MRSPVLCTPMKWADLNALQISTRRPSLRIVCTLKLTLTHLNMHQFSWRHRCSEKTKSSEPLPEVCAAQAPFLVHVTAFDNTTPDSGQQFFAVNKTPEARQHGLRCGEEQAHRQCAQAVYTILMQKLQRPLGIRILRNVSDNDDEVLTDGSSGTRVTGVRTGGIREWRCHPLRSQRVRRSGPSLPQPLHKTDNVERMKKSS